MSKVTVLEGLVFYSDITVAMNRGLCLSMLSGSEKLDLQKRIIAKNNWYWLIIEKIALSFDIQSMASKSFFNHKPTVHVAVAMLKLDKIPLCMMICAYLA